MAGFCIQCGAPLNGNKFCTKCGTAAVDDTAVDLSGFDVSEQTQVIPTVADAPAQFSATMQAAPYAEPLVAQQPAPKKSKTTGAKLGIIAAAVVLGVGAGVGLAVWQPWASDAKNVSSAESSVAPDSSEVSSTEEASFGEDAEASSAAAQAPTDGSVSVSEQAETSAASSSSAAAASTEEAAKTEVNVNVNINDGQVSTSTEEESKYIIPDSDTRRLSRSEVEGMSSDDLSRAQNEIWARHGRMFKNQWLQDYFNSQSWYHGSISPDDFTSAYKSTSIEDDNASLINGILSERGWDVNKAHPN